MHSQGKLRTRYKKTKNHTAISGGSDGKESACNMGDLGLIPGWERSLEKGCPLQHSCGRILWTLVDPGGLQSLEMQRERNEQLSLSLFQEQEQGLPRHLAHSTTKGWADPLSRPSGPTIGLATPYKSPYIRSQLVPPQKVNTGNGSCFCFLILWEESQ